jgi:PhnB protein
MSQVKKIPDGYHSITPYLIVNNGSEAIEYYKKYSEQKNMAG